MILTVTSFKGGTGKTTSAVHLAAYLAEQAPTILVDGDPNRSATGWADRASSHGGLPFRVVDEKAIARAAREATHLVLDTEARPASSDLKELAEVADVLVIPTSPDALALQVTLQTVQQLQAIGATNYAVLLTIVPPAPSRVGDEAAAFLRESGIRVLDHRIPRLMAYQNAAAEGRIVSKVRDENAQRAWSAYQGAAQEVTK